MSEFNEWCILELITQYYGRSAVYSLTPTTEEIVRKCNPSVKFCPELSPWATVPWTVPWRRASSTSRRRARGRRRRRPNFPPFFPFRSPHFVPPFRKGGLAPPTDKSPQPPLS